MEDLELLKKKWNEERPNEFRRYTEEELLVMTQKKSVSVAKWVFMIGILEIFILVGIRFFRNKEILDTKLILGICFLFFISYFYHKINRADNTRTLASQILRLRFLILIYSILILSGEVMERAGKLYHYIKQFIGDNLLERSDAYHYGRFVGLIAFPIVLYLIYKHTYGRLLKKLNENYNELKTLS